MFITSVHIFRHCSGRVRYIFPTRTKDYADCICLDCRQNAGKNRRYCAAKIKTGRELLRDLQIMGQLSYYVYDYQLLPSAPPGSREEDTMFTADVGATYFINRSVWLSASYKYGNFSTNVPDDDFTANTAWLVLGLER